MASAKIPKTFRLAEDTIELLDQTSNASAYVNEVIQSMTYRSREAMMYLRQRGWSGDLIVATLQDNGTRHFNYGMDYDQMLLNLKDTQTRRTLIRPWSIQEEEVLNILEAFDSHQGLALHELWCAYRIGGPIVQEVEQLLDPGSAQRLFFDQVRKNLGTSQAQLIRGLLDLGSNREEKRLGWGGTTSRSMMLYFPSARTDVHVHDNFSFLKVMSNGSVWIRHAQRGIALTVEQITSSLEDIGITSYEYEDNTENVIVRFEAWSSHATAFLDVLEELLELAISKT